MARNDRLPLINDESDSRSRGRSRREPREQPVDANGFDRWQVYRATSDKIPGIPEGALMRIVAMDGDDNYVETHLPGVRTDQDGQQVMGRVPRTMRVTPALFANNTETTDEDYIDE